MQALTVVWMLVSTVGPGQAMLFVLVVSTITGCFVIPFLLDRFERLCRSAKNAEFERAVIESFKQRLATTRALKGC